MAANSHSSNIIAVCPWISVSPGRITIQQCKVPNCIEVHRRDYRSHGTRAPNIDAIHTLRATENEFLEVPNNGPNNDES